MHSRVRTLLVEESPLFSWTIQGRPCIVQGGWFHQGNESKKKGKLRLSSHLIRTTALHSWLL